MSNFINNEYPLENWKNIPIESFLSNSSELLNMLKIPNGVKKISDSEKEEIEEKRVDLYDSLNETKSPIRLNFNDTLIIHAYKKEISINDLLQMQNPKNFPILKEDNINFHQVINNLSTNCSNTRIDKNITHNTQNNLINIENTRGVIKNKKNMDIKKKTHFYKKSKTSFTGHLMKEEKELNCNYLKKSEIVNQPKTIRILKNILSHHSREGSKRQFKTLKLEKSRTLEGSSINMNFGREKNIFYYENDNNLVVKSPDEIEDTIDNQINPIRNFQEQYLEKQNNKVIKSEREKVISLVEYNLKQFKK
jgi:hypothetical protein